MEINIRFELKNLLAVIFLTSIVFMIIALGLALVFKEFDFFLFSQILVYPVLITASVIFFRATFGIKNDNGFLRRAFFIALVVRVITVIALYYLLMDFQGNPFLEGYKDEFMYHSISSYFAHNPQAKLSDVSLLGLPENYGMYPYLVGFFYRCFGAHTFVARFLNAFIGALCVIPFYLFIKNLGMKQETAKLATAFYVFSANFILFNSVQLKDSLTLLLCFLLAYLGSILIRTKRILEIALITVIYFSLNFPFLYIRGQFFFLFTMYYLIFLYQRFSRRTTLDFSKVAIILLIILAVFLVKQGIFPEVSSRLGQFSGDYVGQEFSRYEGWQISGLFGPLIPVITAVTGFFLPFPTLIKIPEPGFNYPVEILKLFTYSEIFFTSIISLFVILINRKTKKYGFNILFSMAAIFYISLLTTAYVAYPRHKLFLIALFLIITAYGIIENRIKLRIVLSLCMTGTFFVFIYNLIRLMARGNIGFK